MTYITRIALEFYLKDGVPSQIRYKTYGVILVCESKSVGLWNVYDYRRRSADLMVQHRSIILVIWTKNGEIMFWNTNGRFRGANIVPKSKLKSIANIFFYGLVKVGLRLWQTLAAVNHTTQKRVSCSQFAESAIDRSLYVCTKAHHIFYHFWLKLPHFCHTIHREEGSNYENWCYQVIWRVRNYQEVHWLEILKFGQGLSFLRSPQF